MLHNLNLKRRIDKIEKEITSKQVVLRVPISFLGESGRRDYPDRSPDELVDLALPVVCRNLSEAFALVDRKKKEQG